MGAVPLTAILSAAKRRHWAGMFGVAFTTRALVAASALALPIAQSVLLFAILLQLCNDWRYQCVLKRAPFLPLRTRTPPESRSGFFRFWVRAASRSPRRTLYLPLHFMRILLTI